MNKKNIYTLSHTHWDREWYRSSNEFKVRAYNTIIDVVEALENNDNFEYFTLDGQYQMVEEALEIDPDLQYRISRLVEKKKLYIGPWYIQPDMNLVDGESISNNLRIGIEETDKKFHSHLNVLWNPDTFTQSPNTPFFVNEFQFDGVYAWRNFAADNLSNYRFYWKGIDGTVVKAVAFPLGYGYFRYLSDNVEENLQTQYKFIDDINSTTKINDTFLMIGSDHASVDIELPNKLKEMNNKSDKYNFTQSNPIEYLNSVSFSKKDMFEGMPVSFKGGRIHPGIGASRMDIKQANLHQQTLISKVLNPILAIVESVGGRNQEKLVNYIYKNLFKNQFHDSIYTSLPEKVNNEVFSRYILNEELINETIYLCSRYIIKNIKSHDEGCEEYGVIFNTLPYENIEDVALNIKSTHKYINVLVNGEETKYVYNDRIVDYESKDYSGLKSLAGKYQVVSDSGVEFGEKYEHTITLKNIKLPAMGYVVYKVSEAFDTSSNCNKNIFKLEKDILILPNDRRIDLNNISVENIEDEGDSYNFSTTEISKTLNLKWELNDDVLVGNVINNPNQNICLKLSYNDNALDLNVKLDNRLENNQTSLVFKFEDEIETETNLHYSNIKNDYLSKYLEVDWKKEGYKEKPLPIYLYSRYLNINNKFMIISNDVTQFYQNKHEIKFTLLRSFDKMGKLDLNYRPGRASGYVLDTPSSQQVKSFEFNFRLYFTGLSCEKVNKTIVKPTSRFIVPTINKSSAILEDSFSLLSIDNKNILFETLYLNESNQYVLRFSNPTKKIQKVTISDEYNIYDSNLLAIKKDSLPNEYVINPNQAKTIILEKKTNENYE